MHCPVTFSEPFPTQYLNHILPNLVLVAVSLISQYTCLSITTSTIQDHLRTIKHHYKHYSNATPNLKRTGAEEAWKHDYRLSTTKLAALNSMRSNLVKQLVKSDTSQMLVERRQRVEEGITALRVAELLKKVEDVKTRIKGSLQARQELIAEHNPPIQHQPASSHKLNNGPTEIIDVGAIKTGHSGLDVLEVAQPTHSRTIKDMMRHVEALANEVDDVADFLDVGQVKVGEEVERLIPAWEAVKKEYNKEEERKNVERMITELSEAMQAVRDGVETVQSICTYVEQTDADEEAEMVKLRKEMALVRLYRSRFVLPSLSFSLLFSSEENATRNRRISRKFAPKSKMRIGSFLQA